MVSKAEAEYGDGAGKRIHLEISDTGGVSGLVSFASWAAVQNEKDDQYETREDGEGGRPAGAREGLEDRRQQRVRHRPRAIASSSTREGDGVDINALKTAVASLDLGKLESMKGVGVQK